ncbi:unnamed protein product [Protopolystoma xenopodis]|uniref:Uncharacterized protein n=1 Tax=Protopolystoma xenopodis TaxID=117903 RepID=A0A3S5CB29_9PLAT|nr:unnamed protein product [Protopolystoma xenopodis]
MISSAGGQKGVSKSWRREIRLRPGRLCESSRGPEFDSAELAKGRSASKRLILLPVHSVQPGCQETHKAPSGHLACCPHTHPDWCNKRTLFVAFRVNGVNLAGPVSVNSSRKTHLPRQMWQECVPLQRAPRDVCAWVNVRGRLQVMPDTTLTALLIARGCDQN